MFGRTRVHAAVVLAVLVVRSALAADGYTWWQHAPGVAGDWFDANNWQDGVPGSESYVSIGNGGVAEITGGEATAQCLYLGGGEGQSGAVLLGGSGRLDVGWEEQVGTGSGAGRFVQTGGRHEVAEVLSITQYGADASSYELDGGELVVGDRMDVYGNSLFRLTGGSATIDAGILVEGMGDWEPLCELGGTGRLSASFVWVGYDHGGRFTQTGGELAAEQALILGGFSGGTFTHSAGTVHLGVRAVCCGTLVLGSQVDGGTDGLGTYEMSGEAVLDANDEWIGYTGRGVLRQTGGLNAVSPYRSGKPPGNIPDPPTGYVYLGYLAGADGTYELSGSGRLEARGLHVGEKGAGRFVLDGDANAAVNWLYVGYKAGASGTVELRGGRLQTDEAGIGRQGEGRFYQTGGHLDADKLYVGIYQPGDGRYELGGEARLDARYVRVGWTAPGTFCQTGGTHRTDILHLGREGYAEGVYELSGPATLEANELTVRNGELALLDAAATLVVSGCLTVGEEGCLTAVPGTVIHMTGSDFVNASTDPAALAGLRNVRLVFEGGEGLLDCLEVAGLDMGPDPAGLEGNFAIAALELGGEAGVGRVRLVDDYENTPDDVLYVEHLLLGAGSYLDLAGQTLYYRYLTDLGCTIDTRGGQMLAVPEPAALGLLCVGLAALLRRRPKR